MTSSKHISSYRSAADRALAGAVVLASIVAASVLLFIVLFLVRESWPAVREARGVRFFTDPGWFPSAGEVNLLPMVAGSLLATAGAVTLAFPLGLASAVFSRFYAPSPVGWWFRRLVELLAGIPSVVFGLWGLVVLVPLLARLGGSGQSLLAAALVLALMILPTVALTAEAGPGGGAGYRSSRRRRLGARAMGQGLALSSSGGVARNCRWVHSSRRSGGRGDPGRADGRRQCRCLSRQRTRSGSHPDRQHRLGDGLCDGQPPFRSLCQRPDADVGGVRFGDLGPMAWARLLSWLSAPQEEEWTVG